jgi:hypothetical protein
MSRLEAFLLIVACLAGVLAYVWRRLGEPSPKHVQHDKTDTLY